MVKWPWYSITFIIILSTAVLIAAAMRNKKGRAEEENSVSFFNMSLPRAADASKLVLECNPGSKIEILGAYFDVFDPWGQCSPDPSGLIAETCETDAADNPGMCSNLAETVENENSLSSQWYRNQICGSRYQTGYEGAENKGGNTEPYGGSDYVCRLQDAAPFLSARCNGEQGCTINLSNADDVGQAFGSLPCYNATTETPLKIGDGDYERLPSNRTKTTDSFQQGYVVRGTYQCVPESK